MEDNYVFVKCKIVGNGKMCYTLEDIVDLVVVGMEYGEYKHKFSIFKDDTIPIAKVSGRPHHETEKE